MFSPFHEFCIGLPMNGEGEGEEGREIKGKILYFDGSLSILIIVPCTETV